MFDYKKKYLKYKLKYLKLKQAKQKGGGPEEQDIINRLNDAKNNSKLTGWTQKDENFSRKRNDLKYYVEWLETQKLISLSRQEKEDITNRLNDAKNNSTLTGWRQADEDIYRKRNDLKYYVEWLEKQKDMTLARQDGEERSDKDYPPPPQCMECKKEQNGARWCNCPIGYNILNQ